MTTHVIINVYGDRHVDETVALVATLEDVRVTVTDCLNRAFEFAGCQICGSDKCEPMVDAKIDAHLDTSGHVTKIVAWTVDTCGSAACLRDADAWTGPRYSAHKKKVS